MHPHRPEKIAMLANEPRSLCQTPSEADHKRRQSPYQALRPPKMVPLTRQIHRECQCKSANSLQSAHVRTEKKTRPQKLLQRTRDVVHDDITQRLRSGIADNLGNTISVRHGSRQTEPDSCPPTSTCGPPPPPLGTCMFLHVYHLALEYGTIRSTHIFTDRTLSSAYFAL